MPNANQMGPRPGGNQPGPKSLEKLDSLLQQKLEQVC